MIGKLHSSLKKVACAFQCKSYKGVIALLAKQCVRDNFVNYPTVFTLSISKEFIEEVVKLEHPKSPLASLDLILAKINYRPCARHASW